MSQALSLELERIMNSIKVNSGDYLLNFLNPEKRIDMKLQEINKEALNRHRYSKGNFEDFVVTAGVRTDVGTDEAFISLLKAVSSSTVKMISIFSHIREQKNKFYNDIIDNAIESAFKKTEKDFSNAFETLKEKYLKEGLGLNTKNNNIGNTNNLNNPLGFSFKRKM